MKGFEPLNHVSIAAVLAGQCIKPTLPHHYNILALPAGLEPATYWLTVSRSTNWTKEAFWQWWRDSNPWTPLREPLPFQGSVLNHSTTSLYLALPAGFEPATYWLTVSRSTYWTKEAILALLAGIEPATHGLTVHRSATELKKHFYFWQREWDSNPRNTFISDSFQDCCFKPLSHPAISGASCWIRTSDILINSQPFYLLN